MFDQDILPKKSNHKHVSVTNEMPMKLFESKCGSDVQKVSKTECCVDQELNQAHGVKVKFNIGNDPEQQRSNNTLDDPKGVVRDSKFGFSVVNVLERRVGILTFEVLNQRHLQKCTSSIESRKVENLINNSKDYVCR